VATERQIAANRANAKKSTGPTSRDGKRRASQNAYFTGWLDRARSTPIGSQGWNSRRVKSSNRPAVGLISLAPDRSRRHSRKCSEPDQFQLPLLRKRLQATLTVARFPHRLVDRRKTRMAQGQLSVRSRLFACSTGMSIGHSQGGTEPSAFVSRDEKGKVIWRNEPNFPQ